MDNIKDFLTVKEAAEFLGVAKPTLRLWESKGKLISYRSSINNYRLFKREDLEVILGSIKINNTKQYDTNI